MWAPKGVEEYYQKFIELQEKLRQSEEERLQLEMKFNEMMQSTQAEEQLYYRRLKSQYKQFLEENQRRHERNERVLMLLERIESRASILEAKTKRLKLLRRQYHYYLQRVEYQDIEPKVEILKVEKVDEKISKLKVSDDNQSASFGIEDQLSAHFKPPLQYTSRPSIADEIMRSIQERKQQKMRQNVLWRNGNYDSDSSQSFASNNEFDKVVQRAKRNTESFQRSQQFVRVENEKASNESSAESIEVKRTKVEKKVEFSECNGILPKIENDVDVLQPIEKQTNELSYQNDDSHKNNEYINDVQTKEIENKPEEENNVNELQISTFIETVDPKLNASNELNELKNSAAEDPNQSPEIFNENPVEEFQNYQENNENVETDQNQNFSDETNLNYEAQMQYEEHQANYNEQEQNVSAQNEQQYQQYEQDAQNYNQEQQQEGIQYDENGQPVTYDNQNEQPIQYQQTSHDENGQAVTYDESNQQQNYYEQDNLAADGQQQQQPQQQMQYAENYDASNAQYGEQAQYDPNDPNQGPYDLSGQQYDENGQPVQYSMDPNEQQQYENQMYDQYGQPIQYDENGQPVYDPNYAYDTAGDQQQYDQTLYQEGQGQQYQEDQQQYNDQQEQQYVEDGQAYQEYEASKETEGEKSRDVLDLLETDTESTKQETKTSHESDFEFSANA